MDVEYVPGGKDAVHIGLVVLVHNGSLAPAVQDHPCSKGELIFRNQPHGENQGVAGPGLFRAGDGLHALVHLGDHHALQALFSQDVGHGMAQIQGDVVIPQTLLNVPGQAAGVGLNLEYRPDMGALQGEPPGHDHADIPGAKNHNLFSHHLVVQVYVGLGHPRGVHAGGPLPRDADGAPGPLPAAHGQDDRLCLNLQDALPGSR